MEYRGYTSVTDENHIIDISPRWADILKNEDRMEFNSRRKLLRHTCPLGYISDVRFYPLYKSEDKNLTALYTATDKELLTEAYSSLSSLEKDLLECIYKDEMSGYEYASKHHLSRSKVSRIRKKSLNRLKSRINDLQNSYCVFTGS